MKIIPKYNKEMDTTLQDISCDLANKEKLLNNITLARMLVLKMHSSMKSFMKDFGEVLVLLNTHNTNQPVLECSLQEMNNVTESVEEASEPKSSFLKPEVATENTDVVQEILDNEIINSPDSEKDKGSTVVNHMSAFPIPEPLISEVLKGTGAGSTPTNLPHDDIEKTTRKRKFSASASNNSLLLPASKRSKKSTFDEQREKESNNQNLRKSFRKSNRKNLYSKREGKSSEEKSGAADSQNEEPLSVLISVESVRRQRIDSHDESTNDKYASGNPTLVKRHIQFKTGTQDEIKNAISRNIDRRGRQASFYQPNASEMEDEQFENGSRGGFKSPNLRNSLLKGKQTLQNKREEKFSQQELSAGESQSEEPRFTPSLVNDGEPWSQRLRKRSAQVELKKTNFNAETCRIRRSKRRAIRVDEASYDGTFISENKIPVKKLSVVCDDVLIDPAFEYDSVLSKCKKVNILNCVSPRDEKNCAKRELHEILDEVEEEQESFKDPKSPAGNDCASSLDKEPGRSILDSYSEPIYARHGPQTPPGEPPDSDGEKDSSLVKCKTSASIAVQSFFKQCQREIYLRLQMRFLYQMRMLLHKNSFCGHRNRTEDEWANSNSFSKLDEENFKAF